MEYLRIKNWEEHQHYKDRCPPWIKLHVKILNDREFSLLSRASKCLQMLLWILASETDGRIKNDINEIRFRLRDETIEESEINLLINKGFLILEDNQCKQVLADACLETETETYLGESDFKFENKVKIPPNIFLTNKMKSYAKDQGCQDDNHIFFMFESFKNWFGQTGRKYQDWTKTFYNWVLKDKKEKNPDKYQVLEDVG